LIGPASPRRTVVVATLAAFAVSGAGCLRAFRTADLVVGRHRDVVYSVPTGAPLVALTFDDGPDPVGTPALLAALARHDARATFFLLGERVPGQEQLVRGIVDAGHELGNHGLRDFPAIDLEPTVFVRELAETHDRLAPFQPELRWYRPGSAWYDDALVERARRAGYTVALGSIYPFDAQVDATSLASWWLRTDAGPGDVIVLHDGPERGPRTAEILDVALPDLAAKGLRGVTLSELVAARRPGD
jgi:peptidoglycan/xylan/chitin deacetylase (PgdA/CDA1 family)